ncbi:hypothetical protein PENFLA_c026G00117 [Penicillium flavigenum]|uniref:Uncharacterized protein n=1 Tax=Penicillium flavigenum TaxID=254877 RepID=A0A1V6ST04_9EURO|nr:hypothetical protein PENFLA_c026G00117 [Penicillium flavigenum]
MGFSSRRMSIGFGGPDHDFLVYGSYRIARYKLTELFIAEHALRELTQLEEKLHHRAIALQKAIALESDGTQLEKANEQLEEAQSQYPRKDL